MMEFSAWLSVAGVCILGAISPGPSLALVVRNTLNASRLHGVVTACAHGLGVSGYAMLTATGLAVLVTQNAFLFRLLQWGGAIFLLYLGLQSLFSRGGASATLQPQNQSQENGGLQRAMTEGFLLAFINPKIALFFLALFSQFVRADAGWPEKSILTATAGVIDALWYSLVAMVLSGGRLLLILRKHSQWLDRFFGVVLIAVAIRVML